MQVYIFYKKSEIKTLNAFFSKQIFVSGAGDLENSIKPMAFIFRYIILHNDSYIRN